MLQGSKVGESLIIKGKNIPTVLQGNPLRQMGMILSPLPPLQKNKWPLAMHWDPSTYFSLTKKTQVLKNFLKTTHLGESTGSRLFKIEPSETNGNSDIWR